jgi:hypothetical protein
MAGGQVSAAPIWRASGGLVGGPALAAENELAGSISIAPEGKTDLPRKPGHIRFDPERKFWPSETRGMLYSSVLSAFLAGVRVCIGRNGLRSTSAPS